VQDLVALLKKDPKRRTFASSGNGTSTHLPGELFADLIGVPLTHVPYKGTPPAMMDVAAGQVTFMFDQMTAALPLLQAGKLKLAGGDHGQAHRAVAQHADHDRVRRGRLRRVSWQAIYAPKGTPKPIVQRLAQEIQKALRLPEVQDKLGQADGHGDRGRRPRRTGRADGPRESRAGPRW
jgi:tripartite-type tricarboxylate transporter receptor subunit TctC